MKSVNGILSNNVIGRVLSFTYNGGSHPGYTRTVYVTELRGVRNNVFGWDFDVQDVRQFCQSKMSEVMMYDNHETKVIDLSVMPSNLRNGYAIKKQYESEGFIVYIDTQGEYLIAVEKQTSPRFDVDFRPSGVRLRAEGKSGILVIEVPKKNTGVVATLFRKNDTYATGAFRQEIHKNVDSKRLANLLEKV